MQIGELPPIPWDKLKGMSLIQARIPDNNKICI